MCLSNRQKVLRLPTEIAVTFLVTICVIRSEKVLRKGEISATFQFLRTMELPRNLLTLISSIFRAPDIFVASLSWEDFMAWL